MKRITVALIILTPLMVTAEMKRETKVVNVTGSLPYKYQIVGTEISKRDQSATPAGDTDVNIVRNVLGYVGQDRTSQMIEFSLEIPQPASNIKNPVPDSIATAIGALSPQAGQVTGVLQEFADIAIDIANAELDNKFNIKDHKIKVLELIPSQYYRINTSTHQVETTAEFDKAFEKYMNLIKQYIPIAKRYNEANTKYYRAYRDWDLKDPLKQNEALKKSVTAIYDNELRPVLQEKLDLEVKLANYTLHRVAIVASPTDPESDCSKAGGSWKGPWKMQIIYYIGAKQTNIFGVDYCVASTDKQQDFSIQIYPGRLEGANFKSGGIVLQQTNNKSLAFPREQGFAQKSYTNPDSELRSWNDELLINENAGGIGEFLVPFSINDAIKAARKLADETKKTEWKDRAEKLSTLATQLGNFENLAVGDKVVSGITELVGKLGGSGSGSGDDQKEDDTAKDEKE